MRLGLWAAGAVAALAFVGCEKQQSSEQQAQGGSGVGEQVEQAQQQAQAPSAMGGAGTAGAQQQVSGTVQSVQANALQLNVPNQGQVTLNVDPSTPVMVDGQQASFEQIEPGHEIRASYSMEGQDRKVTRIEASTSTGGAGESYPSGQPTTQPQPETDTQQQPPTY